VKTNLIPGLLAITFTLSGCATAPPAISPMQMRQFTTRQFDGDFENVYRAAMTVLQDQGYIIKNTDMDAGLIVAQIDKESSRSSQFWQWMFSSNGYIPNKGTLIEASVTVNKLNEVQSEIRMTIQEVTYGSLNNKTKVVTITDPAVYDTLLNEVLIEVKRREAINKGEVVVATSSQAVAQTAPPQPPTSA
jgi:hypothetical protein